MPEDVQRHWRALGWTPSSWQGIADPPPSSEREFLQLSIAEQQAARALGYTPKRWDEETNDPFGTLKTGMMDESALTADQPERPWNDDGPAVSTRKQWAAMTAEQQSHWKSLGWTPLSWHGFSPAPASAAKDFKALSLGEMHAAIALGYSEASWNGERLTHSSSRSRGIGPR